MNVTIFIYATLILLSMSVAPLFMKQLSNSVSDIQVLFLMAFVLAVGSFAVLCYRGEVVETFDLVFTKRNVAFLILLITFLMFLDTWPYIKALQAGADVSVLLSYVRAGGTVCTALLGVYFLGEKLTLMQWLGILLCVGGIVLILVFKSPEKLQ